MRKDSLPRGKKQQGQPIITKAGGEHEPARTQPKQSTN